MCSLSRYVVIGGFTAMAAATAAGSDVVGLLAGAVAVALTMAAAPLAGLGGSCALPPPDTGADATDDPRTAEDATVTLR